VPTDVNFAQVVVKRESAVSSFAYIFTVWVDGQKVGTLANGGSLAVRAAPGRHSLVIRPPRLAGLPSSDAFSFDAQAGERIDLVTRASLGMGRPRIWRTGVPPGQTGFESPMVASSAPAPAANPPVPATYAVVEGSRYEVPLGDEKRSVDNSRSASSTMRVVRLTREWARTCTVDIEHATTVHGSAGLGIHVLELKAEAERTLRKTYSTVAEERQTFAEEVTLNIAQHTKSEIVFSWKEIRQKGMVRVVEADFEAQIPYEVVVGLTFDQQQIDAP
jgi:hypothetical protein